MRLEALTDESLPHHGPGRADNGNFHLTEFCASVVPAVGAKGGEVCLKFVRTAEDHWEANNMAAGAVDGTKETYWSIDPQYGVPHEAVFTLGEPLDATGGSVLTIRLEQNGASGHQVGRFRLSYCTGAMPSELRVPAPSELAGLLASRSPNEQSSSDNRWRSPSWPVTLSDN